MLGSVIYYSFLVSVLCFALRAFVPRRRRNRRLSGAPMLYARQGTTLRSGTTGSAGDRELRRATRAESATRRPPGDGGAASQGSAVRPTLTMPPPGHRLPSLSTGSTTTDDGVASTTRPYGDFTDLSPLERARLERHDRRMIGNSNLPAA